MSVAGIFLLLAFLAGAALIVLWPLLQAGRESTSGDVAAAAPALSILDRLHAEHESILQAIRDLDFDYQTGKLTEEDYAAQRESLMQRGVETLKHIDARQSDLIEEAVRAQRSAPRPTPDTRRRHRRRQTERAQRT
jgi:hypothetical protein